MKRQYPFYVLHIQVPKEIVDVNVHPNKADVRFADNQIIYGCIYSVISSILDGQTKALDYIVRDKTEPITETPVKPERIVAPPKKQTSFGFATLTYEEKQRYTLSLSEKYLRALERFRKECEFDVLDKHA